MNDTFGHQEGDWYIRRFTGIVQSEIRRGDIFARIGGDEFALLLPDCTQETAARKVGHMQRVLASDTTRGYPKNFSCGVTEVPGDHRDLTMEELLNRADSRMYAQKGEHRRTYIRQLENDTCSQR